MIWRIMYRHSEDDEWMKHPGGKGNGHYTTIGAAKGAITHFKKQANWYWPAGNVDTTKYKIQSSPLEWSDVEEA